MRGRRVKHSAARVLPSMLLGLGRLRAQGRSVRQIAAELGYSRGLVHKTLANRRAQALILSHQSPSLRTASLCDE